MTLIFVNWCCKARIPNQSLRSETMNFSIAYLSPDVTQNLFPRENIFKPLTNPLDTKRNLNTHKTSSVLLRYVRFKFYVQFKFWNAPKVAMKFSKNSLLETCPNTEFFLVFIFLYLDWIRRLDSVLIQKNTDQKKLRICTLFT